MHLSGSTNVKGFELGTKLKVPTFFKFWFALCAVLGVGTVTLLFWAVVKLVHHFAK